jgi:hypothetical protein
VIHLVYASRATAPFTAAELGALVAASRRNNLRAGISGMLLSKHSRFLQVLEGPESAVAPLYDRIAQDDRHQEPVVLVRESSGQRQFADSSMGFANLDSPEVAAIPGYTDFLDRPLTPESFHDDPHRSLWLLLAFRHYAR